MHPGTTVYIGYNSDLRNLNRSLGLGQSGNLLRTPAHFLNDGRQIFVKISYLITYIDLLAFARPASAYFFGCADGGKIPFRRRYIAAAA